jgi:hypothetical protein
MPQSPRHSAGVHCLWRGLCGMPLALRLSERLDRARYAARSEHLWIVASSLWSASLAMAVS